jgi:dihydrofolate reductase
MPDIRLIAAVGRQGQLGLGGSLPWRDAKDMRWFRDQTLGHVVLMGKRTAEVVGDLKQRTVVIWDGKVRPDAFIDEIMRDCEPLRTGKRILWIAGGAHTYREFMPHVARAIVSLINYSGPSDTYMPDIWERGDAVHQSG